MTQPAELRFYTPTDDQAAAGRTPANLAIVRKSSGLVAAHHQILWAIEEARWVWAELGESVLYVTSVVDGTHSWTSLHYPGCACDLRTRNLSARKVERARDDLAARLGSDFDVVVEYRNRRISHMHVEWQPKGAA